MTRDSSTLMVGQYFKRKREFVEIFVVSGSGLGISAMSAFVQTTVGTWDTHSEKWNCLFYQRKLRKVKSFGWRLGLQAVTATVFLTFLLGTFYRSASLYHPQRRAILHLKNQKRKIKEKNRQEEKPPLFDVTTLKSRTIQILLFSISLSSFGITTPIIYLAHQAEEEGLSETGVLLLQTYLGLGWITGCCVFGFLVVQRSSECRVGRQYLCQAAMFLCGVSTLAFTAVEGYHGYVLFAWLYGIFSGGFHYTLKMFTYEKVRARNFARTWGYVQCSQAIPTAIGIPITGYINVGYGNKAGYYFSSTLIIFGSMTIFLIDVHRRNAAKHKHTQKHGQQTNKCIKETCPEAQNRRDSLAQLDRDIHNPKIGLLHQRSLGLVEGMDGRNKELTCISEEGIADMDIPDHILEELEYLGDCITSCDKVENYLMMSEYENNLVKTGDLPLPLLEKKNRKRLFSIRQGSSFTPESSANGGGGLRDPSNRKDSLTEAQNTGNAVEVPNQILNSIQTVTRSITPPPASVFTVPKVNPVKSGNFRTISVIEEASHFNKRLQIPNISSSIK
ncbi:Monocarboxylate transporter 10, partial [Armadillidium vulgare]